MTPPDLTRVAAARGQVLKNIAAGLVLAHDRTPTRALMLHEIVEPAQYDLTYVRRALDRWLGDGTLVQTKIAGLTGIVVKDPEPLRQVCDATPYAAYLSVEPNFSATVRATTAAGKPNKGAAERGAALRPFLTTLAHGKDSVGSPPNGTRYALTALCAPDGPVTRVRRDVYRARDVEAIQKLLALPDAALYAAAAKVRDRGQRVTPIEAARRGGTLRQVLEGAGPDFAVIKPRHHADRTWMSRAISRLYREDVLEYETGHPARRRVRDRAAVGRLLALTDRDLYAWGQNKADVQPAQPVTKVAPKPAAPWVSGPIVSGPAVMVPTPERPSIRGAFRSLLGAVAARIVG